MLARPNTMKEIAATVGKPAALERAEQRMAEAVAAHDSATEAVRAAIGENADHRHDAEVTHLAGEERKAEIALRDARDRLLPARADYGDRLSKALQPARQAAAQRVVELLRKLAPEIAALHESTLLIERQGADSVRMPPVDFSHIERVARKIAGQ